MSNPLEKLATNTWLVTLHKLLDSQNECCPRNLKIREIINSQTEVNMSYPIVMVEERKLGYKFMFREAWWIMDGRNTVETIQQYSRAIKNFSNDGFHFDGAYGPRVVDQIRYIVDTLAKDRDSRQAVMTIWRSNPRDSKDIPCTVSIQWLIRDNAIFCIDNMRSSDIWLGWPYDIFNFTMLTGYVMLLLRERGVDNLRLGSIFLNAGSQHIYESNIEAAKKINSISYYVCDKFDPYEFSTPTSFKEYLKALSENNIHVLNSYQTEFGRSLICQ